MKSAKLPTQPAHASQSITAVPASGTYATASGTYASASMTHAATSGTSASTSRAHATTWKTAAALALLALPLNAAAQCVSGGEWIPVLAPPGNAFAPSSILSSAVIWDSDGAGPLAGQLVVVGLHNVPALPSRVDAVSMLTATGWQDLGRVSGGGAYYNLEVDTDHALLLGGTVGAVSSVVVSGLARFDGAAWSNANADFTVTTPQGLRRGTTHRLVPLPNGDLLVAGFFDAVNGSDGFRSIARRTNGAWSTMGAGLSFAPSDAGTLGTAFDMSVSDMGQIVTVGSIGWSASPLLPISRVAVWSGDQWSGVPVTSVPAITLWPQSTRVPTVVAHSQDGTIIAAGTLEPGEFDAPIVWRWSGSAWVPLSGLVGGTIKAILVLPNGNLLVGGEGIEITQQGTSPIALWNGSSWARITPTDAVGGHVADLVLWGDEVIVIGGFANGLSGANGIPGWGWARWRPGPCGGGGCDTIDFNQNGVFPEDQDVVDYLDVLAGGECPACNDIDFNNNGVFPEDQDILDFFNVLAGGDCP